MSDRKSRSFLIRAILLIGVPAIAIAIGGYFYLIGGRFVTTENAYVKADILQISADVEGRVTEVAVKDHQRVKQGDLLFRIDSAPIEIAVARARARKPGPRQRPHQQGPEQRQSRGNPMRRIILALVLVLALGPGMAQAETACAPRETITARLTRDYGERLMATGMQGETQVLEIWSGPSGSFTLLATTADGQSCVVATGTDFLPGLTGATMQPVAAHPAL